MVVYVSVSVCLFVWLVVAWDRGGACMVAELIEQGFSRIWIGGDPGGGGTGATRLPGMFLGGRPPGILNFACFQVSAFNHFSKISSS